MSEVLEALKKVKWKLEDEGILGKEYELCDTIEKALKEHEQYKAIEEELGIDLTLLGKALKAIKYIDHYKEKFFYVKGSSGTIYPVQGAELCYCPTKFFISIISRNEDMRFMTYWLDDYGKTWALTREELEK